MFEIMDTENTNAVIKVIGVGGGGGNAVQHMVNEGVEGVEFICANTDAQALENLDVQNVIQLGEKLTRGLGAGADPSVGRDAALDDRERILEMIDGTDLLFITAGMGGGTGTGAAPVIANIAKEHGILTVGVVTRPFDMEGPKRASAAEHGLQELAANVDSLIIVQNQKLLTSFNKKITLLDVFKHANNVLFEAVQGIADLITKPGLINVDFADVQTVMSNNGMAMMGNGVATGEERAVQATELAISSPLLDDIDLSTAKGILVNITAGLDMGVHEFEEVGNRIREFTSADATVVLGNAIDPEMSDEIKVTVVATGIDSQIKAKSQDSKPKPELISSIAKPTASGEMVVELDSGSNSSTESNLEIPAFLRKQAD